MSPQIGRPETRFAETPKGFVAYQVFGRPEPDIAFVTGWMTNIDLYWEESSAIRYFDRLGEMGRVFLIDKRGSGVSDHSSRGYIDPVEDSLDDVQAVLDASGSTEAILIGDTEGGMLACILAATHPERFPHSDPGQLLPEDDPRRRLPDRGPTRRDSGLLRWLEGQL
jgi:pimeloyl-ACP methyl ester carboxylesterase